MQIGTLIQHDKAALLPGKAVLLACHCCCLPDMLHALACLPCLRSCLLSALRLTVVLSAARGLYRNNPTWVHPSDVVPKDSWRDEATGAMRSHLHYNQSTDLWGLELQIPRNMTPVTLGFVLWYPGE